MSLANEHLRQEILQLVQSTQRVPPGVPLEQVAKTYRWKERAEQAQDELELRRLYLEIRERCGFTTGA